MTTVVVQKKTKISYVRAREANELAFGFMRHPLLSVLSIEAIRS